jgi:aspartyl-tRNA(Asn)/glutamyl-tRNA(Gln) amidotransferase subunit B
VLYAKAIQQILRYTDASDADMEKGMMRFDASISLRPVGESKLYPRAEIKNLNSFRSLETAINFEIERQKEMWEAKEAPKNDTTVGYDDIAGTTFFMRNKEGSDEYRYFPEPDLPPVILEEDFLEKIRETLPEMPEVKYRRYLEEYNLTESEALFLIEDRDLAFYFDEVLELSDDTKKSTSFVLSILVGRLKKDNLGLKDSKISSTQMAELIKKVTTGEISMNIAKGDVFEEMYLTGKSSQQVIEEKGLKSITDEGEIDKICQQVVAENPKSVQDYKGGKENALKSLVGQVMKATRGQANPQLVNETLIKILKQN